MVDELSDQVKAVQAGSLGRAEALLTTQAHTLDLLFNRLTRRAMGCDTIEPFEANMRMALRAQSQCARSLEVLATLKNPPVVIARQANDTTGPQQNNFGVPSRAENETRQRQLSESTHELRQNAGTPCLESSPNSSLEAVGEIDRTKVARG